MDLTTLTQSTDALKGVTDNLGTIILLGTLASVAFVAVYIASFIRKRKVEKGTIQMQKDIHELLMIERSKSVQPTATTDQEIIL